MEQSEPKEKNGLAFYSGIIKIPLLYGLSGTLTSGVAALIFRKR